MNNDFAKVMARQTDDELVEIVSLKRDEYQSLAIEAADKELIKRGLSDVKIEKVKSNIEFLNEEMQSLINRRPSSWIRFSNFIIDLLCYLIFASLLSFLFGTFINSPSEIVLEILGCIIFFASFFIYYVTMEYRFSKTIGKHITRTKVIMVDGTAPSLNIIIARTFYRFIPFDRLSFLFSKNGFHDRLSDTTVVKIDN